MQIIFVSLKITEKESIADVLVKNLENFPGIELMDFRSREAKKYSLLKFAGTTENVKKILQKLTISLRDSYNEMNNGRMRKIPKVISDITFCPISGLELSQCEKIIADFAQDFSSALNQPILLSGPNESANRPFIIDTTSKIVKNKTRKNIPKGINFRIQKFFINMSFVLGTDNLDTAQNIADRIGSRGQVLLNKYGKQMTDSGGQILRGKGVFPKVDTIILPNNIGKTTHLFCKIKDYEDPNLILFYDNLKEICYQELVEILGSSILGYLPLAAIEACYRNLPKIEQNQYGSLKAYIPMFIEALNLNKAGEFVTDYQIIDYHFPT
jgi:glutamate formiminotransferase